MIPRPAPRVEKGVVWTEGDSRELSLPRGCTRTEGGIVLGGPSALPRVWGVAALGVVLFVLAAPEVGAAWPQPVLLGAPTAMLAACLIALALTWVRLWRLGQMGGAPAPELRRHGRFVLVLAGATWLVAMATALLALLGAHIEGLITWGLGLMEMAFVWGLAGVGAFLLRLARAVDPATPPAALPARPVVVWPLAIDFGERGPRFPHLAGPALAALGGGALWTALGLVQLGSWPVPADRAGLLLVELPLGLAPALAGLCLLPFVPAATGPGLRRWQLRTIGLAMCALETVMLIAALAGIALTGAPVPGVLVPAVLAGAGIWMGRRVASLARIPLHRPAATLAPE